LSYEAKVAPNTVWRRHVDQLIRESAVTPNLNKEQYTPHLSLPSLLAATPQSASSVKKNEELQAPTMSGIKKPLTKDTHVDNAPNNPAAAKARPWLAVRQHRHVDVIPFGYGSRQRD